MGGTNETMKEFVKYEPEAGTPPTAGYQATERIYKQGMSGSPNQSAMSYLESLKSFGREFMQDKSPNAFGRQASPPPTADIKKNK